eukprot:7667735-Alexandrium_andersonii.AAC.1
MRVTCVLEGGDPTQGALTRMMKLVGPCIDAGLPPSSCRLLSGRAEGVGPLRDRRPCPRRQVPTSL